MGNKIRILIVDDSILFRETLARGLSGFSTIEVIGKSEDPIDALEKIKEFKPDVITLDVEMPKMSGIDFLKKIIPITPIPVVVVSSLPLNALEAVKHGAVDFVKKPVIKNADDLNKFIVELANKITIASVAKISKKSNATNSRSVSSIKLSQSDKFSDYVIGIGASTGGTEAILEVVKDLPKNCPPIVVVQHIPAGFSKMYAKRLDKICHMSVKEAENSERLVSGQILIAAGDSHLHIMKDSKGFYVRSSPGPKVSGHCPSVDVLFSSISKVCDDNAIGVLLTGMGADGAKGLLEMRKKGSYTIGQDQESSVVYGMPMVAYNIGAVTKQLPLNKISDHIISMLNKI